MDHEQKNDAFSILLCCAVEEEAVHAVTLLEIDHDVKNVPLQLSRGRQWSRFIITGGKGDSSGKIIHVLITGIGLVNASSSLTAFIAERKEENIYVINFGCCGAHVDQLNIGDIVIANSVVPLGVYKLHPDGSKTYGGFKTTVGAPVISEISTDLNLLSCLKMSSLKLKLDYHIGCIGSTDTWTQEINALKEIHFSQNTLCEEMEAAALAQVCSSCRIPFVCVKDISNNELLATSGKQPGALSSLDLSSIGSQSALVAVTAALAMNNSELLC